MNELHELTSLYLAARLDGEQAAHLERMLREQPTAPVLFREAVMDHVFMAECLREVAAIRRITAARQQAIRMPAWRALAVAACMVAMVGASWWVVDCSPVSNLPQPIPQVVAIPHPQQVAEVRSPAATRRISLQTEHDGMRVGLVDLVGRPDTALSVAVPRSLSAEAVSTARCVTVHARHGDGRIETASMLGKAGADLAIGMDGR